ncbi:hypothetical protein [Pediococcus pentosaceus]|uniref:hypothetical protein n=1 Tax=Pediococcus pentosaceus TaxID=1255 RepID=UPI003D80545E
MDNFFTLLLILALIAIWYFIRKKPNKKYKNVSIIVAIISFFIVGLTNQSNSDNKASSKSIKTEKTSSKNSKQSSDKKRESSSKKKSSNKQKESSSKKKPSNKQKESSSKNKNLDEVKLGMTKDEVIKKFGKPSYQTSRNLLYGKKNIYLVDGKVTGGDYDALQKQVDKKHAKKKKEAKKDRIKNDKKKYLAALYALPEQTDYVIQDAQYSEQTGVTFVVSDDALSLTPAELKSAVHKIWNIGQNLSNKYSPLPGDMKSTYITVEDSSGNDLAVTSMWGSFKYKAN